MKGFAMQPVAQDMHVACKLRNIGQASSFTSGYSFRRARNRDRDAQSR